MPRAGRYIGVGSNAAYFGVASVAIPLALVDSGFEKVEVAAYFALGSISAGILNAFVGPLLRRAGFPWWGVLVPHACSLVALYSLSVAAHLWQAFLVSVVLGSLTLVFPFFIGLSSAREPEHSARIVSNLRASFVAGYVTGLASYGLLQLTVEPSGKAAPLWLAAGFVAINVACSAMVRRRTPAAAPDDAPSTAQTRSDTSAAGAVLAVLVVLALVAADTLRSVYMPIVLVSRGFSPEFVSVLLLACVLAEIPLLLLLARLAARWGSPKVLLGVCAAGAASFALLGSSGGAVAVLVASQVVYAVFVAGYQSIGMVYLSDSIKGGLSAGASVFVVMIQVGALLGVGLPLLATGYSNGIFVIAAGLCVVGATLVLVSVLRVARAARHGGGVA